MAGWKAVAPNFINSVIITVPGGGHLVVHRLDQRLHLRQVAFRGSDTIFLLFLVGMFLPYQGILIPLVQTLQWLRPVRHAEPG